MTLPSSTSGEPTPADRLSGLTTWDSPWRGLKAVVAGLGASGFSAADTLLELGVDVVVVDGLDSPANRAKADTLRIVGAGAVLLGAEHTRTVPLVNGETPDVVVTSPGWSPAQPLLADAARRGIPIWGDVELAWRVRIRQGRPTAEWLTITGTNGKTTTVGLTEAMLLAAGKRAVAAGNVGTPILDVIRDPQGFDFLAVELSSFQLHWSDSLAPLASVCLNIAEDHVDWHGGYEAYATAKAKVYERTKVACIYNVDQHETEVMVENAEVQEGCRAIGFTTGTPAVSMMGVVEDLLVDRAFIEQRKDSAVELASVRELGEVVPRHSVANALAAAALVRAAGVAPAAVREGIRAYRPGEHRIQVAANSAGVLWINDSKATNPHAAAASLAAFSSVIWVAGGLSKGVHYDDLVLTHARRLKAVVLIGEDVHDLREALARHAPDVPVFPTGDRHTGTGRFPAGAADPKYGRDVMDRAVAEAVRLAGAGDTVLLAPAAASMDQFSSYAHRGTAFLEAVHAVLEGQAKTSEEL